MRGSVDVHSRLVTEKQLIHNSASIGIVDYILLIQTYIFEENEISKGTKKEQLQAVFNSFEDA